MTCIKCGRKLKSHKVFCDECLAQAENYPVDPDIPITLPKHVEVAPGKKRHVRKRPALPPEEQLPRLRKIIRRLVLVLLILLALLSASLWLVWNLLQQDKAELPALYHTASVVSRETI